MLVYLLFIIGFILLLKGADLLVDGSSSLARKFNVPPLVIGLTIVAFGTSMPEFVVNMISAFQGTTDVAMGNIIGSNIFNILFILGISSLLIPLKVQNSTIWKEIPFALLSSLIVLICANDVILDGGITNVLTRTDGLIMIGFFGIFLYYVFELSKVKKEKKSSEPKIKNTSNLKIFLMIVGGLAMLVLGGKWVVDGAVEIARIFGIAEYIISATIVAAGTSLPELATSVIAAKKKEFDLSVGNIVGSNIFNVFWILGVTSVITAVPIAGYANMDILISLVVTSILFIFMFIGTRHSLDRWQGILFLLSYVLYVIYLLV